MTPTEKALHNLIAALEARNRLTEQDEFQEDHKLRTHTAIDFTYAQLKRIGKAIREGHEVLAAVPK